MNIHFTFLFTTIIYLWPFIGVGQYTPKHQRNIRASNYEMLKSLRVEKKQKLTILKPVLICDSLIMKDGSIIQTTDSISSFTIYARYCTIGKNCIISTKGRNGLQNAKTPTHGEWGSNGAHINLYLNIYALGNLTIDTQGGNGGNGYLPGVYGAGGDVKLEYYAPFIINISKKRRRRRKHTPSIVVYTKKGRMNLTRLRKLRDAQSRNQLNANNPLVRIDRSYNPTTKTTQISTPYSNRIKINNQIPNSIGNLKPWIKRIEQARLKRKDGEINFKRIDSPIKSEAIKITSN